MSEQEANENGDHGAPEETSGPHLLGGAERGVGGGGMSGGEISNLSENGESKDAEAETSDKIPTEADPDVSETVESAEVRNDDGASGKAAELEDAPSMMDVSTDDDDTDSGTEGTFTLERMMESLDEVGNISVASKPDPQDGSTGVEPLEPVESRFQDEFARRKKRHTVNLQLMKAVLTLHVLCFMSVDAKFQPTIHHSRPGTTLMIREGNDLNTRGIALIKAGGFVVRKGPTGGTDLDGWEVPTDGNYTRTYSNWDSWVATKENGEIYCWGSALSIKSCPVSECTTTTCTEADVESYYPKPIKYIYSCKRSYCALYVDKTVFCWMAGYGPTQEPSPPGKGWVTATSNDFLGYSFLNEDGSVWSRNIGGNEVKWIDTPPSGEERFLSLHSAGNVFAGLTDTGRIAAWGLARYYGEILGESRQTMNVETTGYGKAVSGVPAEGYYTAIRAGKDSFCALWVNGTVNGAIHCWGATKKRIGDTTASGLCPSSICRRPTDDGYVSLHSNHYSYVAVKADGTIYPFGDKDNGGLLPQSGGAHAVQGPVYAGNFLHDVSYVVSSMSAHVAVFNNGTLACWGYEDYGGANFYHGRTGCPSGSGFTNVSASERGFAALDPAGAVISWGQWGNQRLVRTTNSSDEWGLDGFVRLWMQRWEFLAQKADGTIVYFGKRSSVLNAAYFPEPTMDTDRCQHNPRTRASCTWSEADIAETSWVLCKSKGNYNAVNLGIGEDAECGGGATPGDPLVSINKFLLMAPSPSASPVAADSESEGGSTDIGAEGVGGPINPTSPVAPDSESEGGSTDSGAGVGLALGLVLALSGCFCCWWFFGAKRRKNKVQDGIVEARKAGSNDAWVAYASPTEAAKALELEPTHVSECLSGKTQNTGGYDFRYAGPPPNLPPDSESEGGSTDSGAGVGLALGLVLALSGCSCCWWFFGAKRRKNKVQDGIVEARKAGSDDAWVAARKAGSDDAWVAARKAGSDDAWVAYASPTEAAKALELEPTHVSECLSGKTQNTGGYDFRYAGPPPNLPPDIA